MTFILFSVLILVAIATILAVVLYANPQDDKEISLRGINCDGCSFSGCNLFAENRR